MCPNDLCTAVDRYDPATDTWTTLSTGPRQRDHLAVVAAGGQLYGISGRRIASQAFDVVESFAPGEPRWRPEPPLRTPRGGHAAALLDGRIHVIGGVDGRMIVDHEVFDPVTGTWGRASLLPTARHGLAAAVAGGRLCALAGALFPGLSLGHASECLVP